MSSNKSTKGQIHPRNAQGVTKWQRSGLVVEPVNELLSATPGRSLQDQALSNRKNLQSIESPQNPTPRAAEIKERRVL